MKKETLCRCCRRALVRSAAEWRLETAICRYYTNTRKSILIQRYLVRNPRSIPKNLEQTVSGSDIFLRQKPVIPLFIFPAVSNLMVLDYNLGFGRQESNFIPSRQVKVQWKWRAGPQFITNKFTDKFSEEVVMNWAALLASNVKMSATKSVF